LSFAVLRLPPGRHPGYTARVVRWLQAARERWLAIALVGLGCALLGSAVAGEHGLAKIRGLRRELAHVNDRNFQLVQGIDRARTELHRIRTDDAALDRVARRRLGLVRDGETLYQVEGLSPLAPPGKASRGPAP